MSAVLISSVCDDDESSEQFEDRERRLGAPSKLRAKEKGTQTPMHKPGSRKTKTRKTSIPFSLYLLYFYHLAWSTRLSLSQSLYEPHSMRRIVEEPLLRP